MDKKIAGLLGAAAALTAVTAAQATTPTQGNELPPATSYRDLLNPIPNPIAALRADDARPAETPVGGTQVAQYHHHHHHHHHIIPRPFRRHHHHHHHHHHH